MEAQQIAFIREANRSFMNAEGLSDGELLRLIEFYSTALEHLIILGAEFRLATNEIRRRLEILKGFDNTRNGS